jgi:glutaredoxin
MTHSPTITILPAEGCRRSQAVLAYLEANDIRYERIELASEEGQEMAARYEIRSSPGMIVDGELVNPFDLLIQPACRIDEGAARRLFGIE